ncbi:MAG: tetratricopeptide repeat protein [Deltaproteobacteria bacterium]|nr:tetratricopeptide repeat protein [Deltaproteobacteria bacterium]
MNARRRSAAPAVAAASTPPLVAGWRRPPTPAVASLLVFVLAVVAFANTFGHGFVWDDSVLLDQKVRFYTGWLDAWREPPGLPNMRMDRPLELMTLWIDRRLWRASTGFHVTQVLLHAVNGVLVLRLARALGMATWAALAAAALFVVHPVQVESVAWLTCRADVLTGTFAMLAMLAFLRGQAASTWWAAPAVAAASFLATAAKETGSVTPALLVAALAVIPRPEAPAVARLRRAWPALVASLVGVLLCQALRPPEVTTGIGRSALDGQDLLNLAGAFGYQIARVVAPVDFAPYVPTTPTDPGHVALAALGALGLGVLALRPCRDGVRRLGALWFVIAVAPAVAVVLADFSVTPVAERRLYLGMTGVALLVASALHERRALAASGPAITVIALVLATLLATTVARNRHWRDDLTLWSAVAAAAPDDALPSMNLGLALAAAGRASEAEAAYRRALALRPRDVTRQRTCINLGLLLVERGALDEAEALFARANAIAEHAIAERGLAMIARRRGQAARRAGDVATAERELSRALDAAERALAINPRYPQGHATLAGALYDAGRYREALAHYQRAAALAGDDAVGRDAAESARQLGDWLAAHPAAR